MGISNSKANLQLELLSEGEVIQLKTQNTAWHRYSDLEPFERLMKVIRYIAHHPFQTNTKVETDSSSKRKTQKDLIENLQTEANLIGHSLDSLQRDIEKVLKPLWNFTPV